MSWAIIESRLQSSRAAIVEGRVPLDGGIYGVFCGTELERIYGNGFKTPVQVELEARLKNFHADVLLIFSNCRAFNADEQVWCTYADEKERDSSDLLIKLRSRVKRVLNARPDDDSRPPTEKPSLPASFWAPKVDPTTHWRALPKTPEPSSPPPSPAAAAPVAGGNMKRKRPAARDWVVEASPEPAPEPEPAAVGPALEQGWVQCESCEKWRPLPQYVEAAALRDGWTCGMATWVKVSCSVSEGEYAQLLEKAKVKAEKKAAKKASAAAASAPAAPKKDQEWAQCESCEKWRPLPFHIDAESLDDPWSCGHATWISLSCDVTEKQYLTRIRKRFG
jgi:hypothetical protein